MTRTLATMAVGALLAAPVAGFAAEQEISAEAWARPRDGVSLIEMAALRETMRALAAAPEGVVLVRHPPGEMGLLWAEELRSWLVALGLSSSRLRSEPDGARDDAVYLEVLAGGEIAR